MGESFRGSAGTSRLLFTSLLDMSPYEMPSKDMSTVELRENLSDTVIVPYEDIKLLEALENQKDIEDSKKALKEAAKNGTISLAELKKELGLSD
jgi:hypothetical protein